MGKKDNSPENLRFVNALMPRLVFTATPDIPHTETNGNPVHLAIMNAASFVTGTFLAGDFKADQRRQAQQASSSQSKEIKPPERGSARLSTLSRAEEYEEVEDGDHSMLSDVGDGREVSIFEPILEAEKEDDNLLASSVSPSLEKGLDAKDSKPYASLKKRPQSEAVHSHHDKMFSSSYPGGLGDFEKDNVEASNAELQDKLRNVLQRLEALHHKNEELQTRVRERELAMQNMKSVIGNLQAEISEYKKTVVDLRQHGDTVDSKNRTRGKLGGRDGYSLEQENEDLRLVIEKLNIELAHYQEKFRTTLPNDENGLPLNIAKPPWLTSTKYLSPLILAFDDRLNEKEVEVRDLERQVLHLKEAMDEIVRENQLLHVSNSMPADTAEWERVKEQAKLVLEENNILLEQLNVERSKTKQQQEGHKNEVVRLTRKIVAAEADKAYYESEFQELNEKCLVMKKRLEPEGATEFVSVKAHKEALQVSEQKLTDFKNQAKFDFEALLDKLEKAESEIRRLKEDKMMGREELDNLHSRVETIVRAQRKWQEKAVLLEKKLLYAEEREQKLNEQLSVALGAAEQAVQDRDSYSHEVRLLLDEKNDTISDLHSRQLSDMEMEEKLRNYRSHMKQKVKKIAEAHIAKKKEFEEKELHYLTELESLRKTLATERLKNEEMSRS